MSAFSSSSVNSAASQSTVFIVSIDDGEGQQNGNTGLPGGSVSGQCFGVTVSQVQTNSTSFVVDLAGSASGKPFFRQVRVNNSILLNSADAGYTSATNTWAWNTPVSPGSYTLRFFR